jgi:hypothetical protein
VAGEPIPTWARAIAIVVAVVTGLILIPTVVLGALSLASTVGQVERTTTLDVGPAPRLRVEAPFGSVAIVLGRDDRIVVRDRRSSGTITRAAAAAVLRQIAADVSRRGDLVLIRQSAAPFTAPELSRDSSITIEVPMRTDVDVRGVTTLRIQGIDGAVHFQGSGQVDLTDVTLRDGSRLDNSFGDVVMSDVTVAGRVVVTKSIGAVRFGGQLAPGGSSLDIENHTGDVTVVLPRPTDARAVVSTQVGNFRADGTFLFTPDRVVNPRRWTADLGPSPTGTVTVRTSLGSVAFRSR